MKTRPHARGSALVLAMMIVLVLSVIAVAVVRLGTNETAGALAGARRGALAQCAEAATNLLLSKFHTLGIRPDQIVALNVPLDGPGGQTRAMGGHIDTMNVTLGQVAYLPDNAFGPPAASDDTGVIRLTGQGGKPMKVTVHCQDGGDGTAGSGRQLEVELGVRFGL
jgi:hypothetical protein